MVLPRPVPATGCGEKNRAPGSYAVCSGSLSGFGKVHNGAIVPHYAGPTGIKDILDGASATTALRNANLRLSDKRRLAKISVP
jgi:hypothetical protein